MLQIVREARGAQPEAVTHLPSIPRSGQADIAALGGALEAALSQCL